MKLKGQIIIEEYIIQNISSEYKSLDRSHNGLDGKTPADQIGFTWDSKENNKWLQLIRLATS